jgi:hypothetical protein
MNVLPDLSPDPRAQRVVKVPLPVRVRIAEADGICETLEGPVRYLSGDAILTGVADETWPVARKKFDERYMPAEGTPPGADGEYVKRPLVVLALRLDVPIDVPMPNGGMLHGEPGDWLLQHGTSDYGLVKDEILRATYEFC